VQTWDLAEVVDHVPEEISGAVVWRVLVADEAGVWAWADLVAVPRHDETGWWDAVAVELCPMLESETGRGALEGYLAGRNPFPLAAALVWASVSALYGWSAGPQILG